MTRNRHEDPRQKDAESKAILIENELDGLVDAALAFCDTIRASGSRVAVLAMIEDITLGNTTDIADQLPEGMIWPEVLSYAKPLKGDPAYSLTRLLLAKRALLRFQKIAGMVDA